MICTKRHIFLDVSFLFAFSNAKFPHFLLAKSVTKQYNIEKTPEAEVNEEILSLYT
jgi:hypothetical protein